jgi:transposase InsO family protein
MPWKDMGVQQQRAEFVVRAQRQERTIKALCKEYGISRATGYLWLARYEEQGIDGLKNRSRRPVHSPQRTPAEIEQRIVALRQGRPDWGARKLKKLLHDEGVEVPRITVHRVLVRHGLISEAARLRRACQRFERAAPNELWQMDFKGPITEEHPIGPLSVLDDHSRYLIALEGSWTTKAEAVKECLTTAFMDCGLPNEALMDHGTPWWNPQAPSGWSKLLVWIMKQGICCHFSFFRHPQTQGKVERFHESLERACRMRDLPPQGINQAWLDAFRQEYNYVRPHEALEMKTPASVWRPSERKYDRNPPEWDYGEGAEVKKLGSQGKLTIDGYRWSISKALAGEWVELKRTRDRILVYYCNSLIRELEPAAQRSTAVERWAQPETQQKV